MVKHLINKLNPMIISILLLSFVTSGCLEDRPSAYKEQLSLPTSWFKGVDKVQNLGGFPVSIKVSWEPSVMAKKYKIYSVIKNPITNETKFNFIDEVSDAFTSSYIHRDNAISPGVIYTYKVNAVDMLNIEDPNVEQKSTIAFEGIQSVTILSKTSAQVTLASVGAFDKLQVVAHPVRMGEKSLGTYIPDYDAKKEFRSADGPTTIDGLIPGTTYSFNIQARIDEAGNTDGNEMSIVKQTASDSFGTGESAETTLNYQYRSVRLIQAFGNAPNELNNNLSRADARTAGSLPADLTDFANPHEKVIRIVPNPFAGATNTKVRVVRIGALGPKGGTLLPAVTDFKTNTKKICTSADSDACVVCDHVASSSPKEIDHGDCDLQLPTAATKPFIDKSIADAPRKYFYTITKVQQIVKTGSTVFWPEELPLVNYNDFAISVHVPENNMVLAQRESVNFEMCQMLTKTPDPRKFNRCVYKGIAATPYTTSGDKITLEDGFYDFGYNFMADRHALSCNWSRKPNQNECGQTGGCVAVLADGGHHGLTADGPATDGLNFTPENLNPYPALGSRPTFIGGNTDSMLALFTVQARGNNCYGLYHKEATLNSGANPAVSSAGANVTETDNDWISIGRLALIAQNLSDGTQKETKTELSNLVRRIATADPGPLGTDKNYADRKQPIITGLTNNQAQSLCGVQSSTYKGTKRLMRRREYIASTGFPTTSNEPGFTNSAAMNAVVTGTSGQTLYSWDPSSSSNFSGGTNASLGQNPGACAHGDITSATMSTNPRHVNFYTTGGPARYASEIPINTVVNPLSPLRCDSQTDDSGANNIPGCRFQDTRTGGLSMDPEMSHNTGYGGPAAGYKWDQTQVTYTTGDFSTDILSTLLDPKNEMSVFLRPGINWDSMGQQLFFSGSLATNKCLTRYGMQDPISTQSGGSDVRQLGELFAAGFTLSDRFKQIETLPLDTNDPIFVAVNSQSDRGVVQDYILQSVSSKPSIQFRNDDSGYTSTSPNATAYTRCVATASGQSFYWQTNNNFWLGTTTTSAVPQATVQTSCQIAQSGEVTRHPAFFARRDHSDFPGFLPILGIPLRASAQQVSLNRQDQISFSSMLFGNQFGSAPDKPRTKINYSVTNSTNEVNMTTGSNSRWSYELSEAPEQNAGGMAWCGFEVE